MQLSELGCRVENENAQTSKQQQMGDSNPGSLDCESGIPRNLRIICPLEGK